jgi:hypothetical protein
MSAGALFFDVTTHQAMHPAATSLAANDALVKRGRRCEASKMPRLRRLHELEHALERDVGRVL